jgi:CxxC-x17-CxxC domain-containing protein
MFEVKCTECGKTDTVPFKPTEGKPVYCRECFSKLKAKPREKRHMPINFESKLAWARRRPHGRTQSEDGHIGAMYKFSRAPD